MWRQLNYLHAFLPKAAGPSVFSADVMVLLSLLKCNIQSQLALLSNYYKRQEIFTVSEAKSSIHADTLKFSKSVANNFIRFVQFTTNEHVLHLTQLDTASGSGTAEDHEYFTSHWVTITNWSHTYHQCFRCNLSLNNQRHRTAGTQLSTCSGSSERHFLRRILAQIADYLAAPFREEVKQTLSDW